MEKLNPVDGSFLDVFGVEEFDSAPDQAKFACYICKKNIYTHKRYLTRHLKSQDANAKDVRCSDCQTYFKDRQSVVTCLRGEEIWKRI